MKEDKIINRAILVLLLCSFVLRAFVAGFIELGNDEVYYWTYAKFPDWSHFDHPPMVGLLIQLFTINLHFDSEFFLRLGSVVLGTASTWLIFLIGKRIKMDCFKPTNAFFKLGVYCHNFFFCVFFSFF